MNFLNKMERKFGRYAIRNISLMMIICYAFGYAIQFVNASFLDYLVLNPYQILHGQVWRLITWILIPPSGFSIFTMVMLYVYYSLGTLLERTWGTFRYNAYLFCGLIFTIIGSFLLYGYYFVVYSGVIGMVGAHDFFTVLSRQTVGGAFYGFSTMYVNLSIFLAFAMTFPDMQMLFMFIIPIKVKWLGIIDAVFEAYLFLSSGIDGKIIIGASLLNVLLFFLMTRNMTHVSPKQIRRRQEFRNEVRQNATSTRHKCAICGRTEKDGDLEFRFCSKCEGNYEYCQDHLFTHEHVHRH